MTKFNDRVASISNPFFFVTNYLFLSLLAMLKLTVDSAKAELSVAAQNKKHKECITNLSGDFNQTKGTETCSFSYTTKGIRLLGECEWCPPQIPTKRPTRAPRASKKPTPKRTGGPTDKPTPEPTPKPTPGPTKPPKPTKRPTRRTRRPTRPPTPGPICPEAIGVKSSNLKSLVAAAKSGAPLMQSGLNHGLMRFMLDGWFKYCVITAVSQRIYQFPASCMFSITTSPNNGSVSLYIPQEWYQTLELKPGFEDFDPDVDYPRAQQAFYPLEFLGPNPQLYNFALVTTARPIPFTNEFTDIDPAVNSELIDYVTAHAITPSPNKSKKAGRRLTIENA